LGTHSESKSLIGIEGEERSDPMNDYRAELGFFLCIALIALALCVDMIAGRMR
jgi:hypothetical protein